MWLTSMTRPDIADADQAVARHSHSPCERHWVAAEKILDYLNATRDLGITYERGSRLSLTIFADADYTSKATGRRSISRVAVMLGGAAVCAISRTQHRGTLSTTEAEYVAMVEGGEYVAMSEGVKEGLFVRPVLALCRQGLSSPLKCMMTTRGPSQWHTTPCNFVGPSIVMCGGILFAV